jgi:hypothetical protein
VVGLRRFAYVESNLLGAVDPDGLPACLVELPDMQIDTGLGFSSTSLGWGAVECLILVVMGPPGYYVYGRYLLPVTATTEDLVFPTSRWA